MGEGAHSQQPSGWSHPANPNALIKELVNSKEEGAKGYDLYFLTYNWCGNTHAGNDRAMYLEKFPPHVWGMWGSVFTTQTFRPVWLPSLAMTLLNTNFYYKSHFCIYIFIFIMCTGLTAVLNLATSVINWICKLINWSSCSVDAGTFSHSLWKCSLFFPFWKEVVRKLGGWPWELLIRILANFVHWQTDQSYHQEFGIIDRFHQCSQNYSSPVEQSDSRIYWLG